VCQDVYLQKTAITESSSVTKIPVSADGSAGSNDVTHAVDMMPATTPITVERHAMSNAKARRFRLYHYNRHNLIAPLRINGANENGNTTYCSHFLEICS